MLGMINSDRHFVTLMSPRSFALTDHVSQDKINCSEHHLLFSHSVVQSITIDQAAITAQVEKPVGYTPNYSEIRSLLVF